MAVGGPPGGSKRHGKRIIHRGVWVPAGARLTAIGDELPGRVDFTLDVLEKPAPRLVISELRVSARRKGPFAIQSTDLRKIKVPDLLTEAVRAIVKENPSLYERRARDAVAKDPALFSRIWTPPKKRPGHGRIFPDSKLPQVARIYRANPRRGYRAVAEKLGVPRSTAGEYIRRAKEAGLLDVETPRRTQ
jgi:hypothetical protein